MSVPCSLRRGVYLNSVSMKSGLAHPVLFTQRRAFLVSVPHSVTLGPLPGGHMPWKKMISRKKQIRLVAEHEKWLQHLNKSQQFLAADSDRPQPSFQYPERHVEFLTSAPPVLVSLCRHMFFSEVVNKDICRTPIHALPVLERLLTNLAMDSLWTEIKL